MPRAGRGGREFFLPLIRTDSVSQRMQQPLSGSRQRGLAHARAVTAFLAVTDLGLPTVHTARALRVSRDAVWEATMCGEALLAGTGVDRSELLGDQRPSVA